MIQRWTVVTVLVAVCGLPCGHAVANPPAGAIAGQVKDEAGNPIIGALVKVIDPTSFKEPIRTLRTDAQGRFVAKSLIPGQYRLRAEAQGFISVAHPIEIKPDVTLTLTFELKRLGTLAQEREDRDDYRWLVRASRRHVLRFNKNGETASDDFLRARAGGRFFPSHGMIQWVASGRSRGLASQGTLNFVAVSQLTPTTELLFTGQVSGANSPSRFELMSTSALDEAHALTLAVGMATVLPETGGATPVSTKLLSVRVTDSWKVADSVALVYGADVTKVVGHNSAVAVLPRLGVHMSLPGRSQMTAEWVPVRTQDVHARFDHHGRPVLLTEPETPAVVNGRVMADRTRRFQLQWEKGLGETSTLEAAFFFDDVAGRGTSMIARPLPVSPSASETIHVLALNGRARGLRLMYRHRLSETLQATVGYAVGHGLKLSPQGLEDPEQAVTPGFFQVFAAQLDALISPTRTRLSAHFRAASRASLFAIDPFYTRLPILDPSLSLMVTQELPLVALLPGHWEAGVDVRNVLDLPSRASSDRGILLLHRPQRFVRGSVSVRF